MNHALTFPQIEFSGEQPIRLLFIHGWGMNSGVWQSVLEHFRSDYAVAAIDLPGFGKNVDSAPDHYTLDNLVDLIAAQIDKPVVVIGWSLGGLVATSLALRYPDKINALVNVASSPLFVEQTRSDSEIASDAKPSWPGIKARVLKGFHLALSEDTKKTIENFLKIQAMGSPHIRQDIKKLRDWVMVHDMPSKTVLEQSLSLLSTVDLRPQLQNITQPSLRLYGRLDTLVPQKAIKIIDQLMPKSESYTFDKASHAPFISHETLFLEKLNQWLSQNLS